MVKYIPEFEYFTVFLKNRNIIYKIRRSKVTDYAALSGWFTLYELISSQTSGSTVQFHFYKDLSCGGKTMWYLIRWLQNQGIPYLSEVGTRGL